MMTKIALEYRMIKRKYRSREKKWPYQRERKSCNIDYAMLKAISRDLPNVMNSVKLKYNDRRSKNFMTL